MLTLRSVLTIDALDEPALRAARRAEVDAVLIDLAAGPAIAHGDEARASATKHARALARAGRMVLARVSAPRTGAMDADVDAIVGAWLAGVVIVGVEEPQDTRDVDVQVRKWEMRRTKTPGAIRLIAEVDSATGLLALPHVLSAIDRFSAVLLDLDAVIDDIRAPAAPPHVLGTLATLTAAHSIDWLLRAHEAEDAAVAYEHGAAGVVIDDLELAPFAHVVFTPETRDVRAARRIVAAWKRRRGAGAVEVDGALVDGRVALRAERLVAQAEAIAHREG